MIVNSTQTISGNATIGSWLDHWLRSRPEALYLIWDQPGGQRLSYTHRDLHTAVCGAASLLHESGIAAGDRFCVHLRNRPETVALLFAAAMVGATLIPTNTGLTPRELAYVLDHGEVKLIVTEPTHAETVQAAVNGGTARPKVLVFDDVPSSNVATLFPGEGDVAHAPVGHVDNRADVVVMYTSGTTSNPKGVRISQLALINAGHAIAAGVGFGPDDRHLAVLPLFHINSLCYVLMTALVTGGSVVLSERFSASRYFRQAAETGATFGWMAATPLRMLLAQPASQHDREHPMRRVVFGQNLTSEEYEVWHARFGASLQQIYGMTETVTLPIMNPLNEESRLSSMGRPAPGVEARIDIDGRKTVTPGEKGELQLRLSRGEQMMSGYLNNPEANSAAFDGEWFRTGDIVQLDEEGFLHFVDRRHHVLKVSGENVSASEIEMVLNRHSSVFDAAVVGQPDTIRGQVVKAFVVLQVGAAATEAELVEWCRARLAPFKVPVAIEFREDFPRTSAGKVQKNLL